VRLGERQGGVEVGCLEDGVADDLTGAGGRAIGRDADTAGDGVPKSTMRSPTSAGPGGPSAHDGFHLLGGGRRCFRGVIGAWWVKTYLGMICCFSQNRRGPTTSGRVFLTRCAVRQCLLESPAPAMIWSRPMEIVARETAPILDVCHHCLRTATSRDYVTKGAGRPILNRLRWRRHSHFAASRRDVPAGLPRLPMTRHKRCWIAESGELLLRFGEAGSPAPPVPVSRRRALQRPRHTLTGQA